MLFTHTAHWHVVAAAHDTFNAVSAARREHADVVLLATASAGLSATDVRALLAPSGVLVVEFIDRPEQHASTDGPAILKSIPFTALTARLTTLLDEHWSQRPLVSAVTR